MLSGSLVAHCDGKLSTRMRTPSMQANMFTAGCAKVVPEAGTAAVAHGASPVRKLAANGATGVVYVPATDADVSTASATDAAPSAQNALEAGDVFEPQGVSYPLAVPCAQK